MKDMKGTEIGTISQSLISRPWLRITFLTGRSPDHSTETTSHGKPIPAIDARTFVTYRKAA